MTEEELIARLRLYGSKIEALTKERDHWSDVAGREGVCMTCRGPYGAPEPYGCTDCLNTGYCGEHHNTVADLEAKLAKAVEEAEKYKHAFSAQSRKLQAVLHIEGVKATLAEIKGGNDAKSDL